MAFAGILPRIPSAGERLAGAIGGGLQKGFGSAQDFTMKMMEKNSKNSKIADLLKGETGRAEHRAGSDLNSVWEGMTPEQKMQLHNISPETAKFFQNEERSALQNRKVKQELEEKKKSEDTFRSGIEDMESKLSGKREGSITRASGRTWFGMGPESAAQRAQFDAEGVAQAFTAYTKNYKGPLTNAKIELIEKTFAPNSRLSIAENAGRIKALKRMYGLSENIPPEKFDKIVQEEAKKLKKLEKKMGKKLSRSIVDRFLDESGGNWEEAEKLAKEAGYEF